MFCFSSAINRLVDNKSLGATVEKRYIIFVWADIQGVHFAIKAVINVIPLFIELIKLGRVVRKPVNVNPGLNVN